MLMQNNYKKKKNIKRYLIYYIKRNYIIKITFSETDTDILVNRSEIEN